MKCDARVVIVGCATALLAAALAAPVSAADAPAKLGGRAKADAPAKSDAPVKPGAPVKSDAPLKSDAPAKPDAPENAETPSTSRLGTGRKTDPAATAVNTAVAALGKEWQAYAKDPNVAKLRTDCSFFTDNPSTDVTPAAIIAALEKPLPGRADAQAYVKWQLLSAVPDKFDDKLVPRAVAAYANAPRPAPHPGLNKDALVQMGYRIPRQPDQIDAVNQQFSAAIQATNALNDPIIKYRDGLYARLPATVATLKAGLSDLYDRVRLGAECAALTENVVKGINNWSSISPATPDVIQVGTAVEAIRSYANDSRDQPYVKLQMSGDGKKMEWRTENMLPQNGATLNDAEATLADAVKSASGQGQLGFKKNK